MKRHTTPKDTQRVAIVPGNTLLAGVPSAGKTPLVGKVVPARRPAKDR
jgi:hypothetical protein